MFNILLYFKLYIFTTVTFDKWQCRLISNQIWLLSCTLKLLFLHCKNKKYKTICQTSHMWESFFAYVYVWIMNYFFCISLHTTPYLYFQFDNKMFWDNGKHSFLYCMHMYVEIQPRRKLNLSNLLSSLWFQLKLIFHAVCIKFKNIFNYFYDEQYFYMKQFLVC